MLKAIGSRLTYANVMATGAMFVALGGGAYAVAATSDPHRVFHGCVSKRTGVLRVVGRTASCMKAHDRGTHRNPGERSINWSQRGPKGPRGTPGRTGTPGQDATKLFAYVDDFNDNTFAAIQYGNGVTAVDDPDGSNPYTVTFDRDLKNCVVLAQPEFGYPTGNAGAADRGTTLVTMNPGGNAANQVKVGFRSTASATAPAQDSSFVIAAFC